ncbi:MAG: 2-C-methyl-D-erythritol 4-phosphate cytidylyltransferase [Nitrospiraceae bacterium]|nr:2-C-methyl-D-erythritol 4-phosphate cytidylyltransferase [Nitrospiraceae bacterium]
MNVQRQSIIALVPAAGSGTRLMAGVDKAFFELEGKPLLFWTLRALERVPEIDEIIPAVKAERIAQTLDMARLGGLKKIRRIARGGKERQDSVSNALALVPAQAGIVLIHDAARPFAAAAFISRLIAALEPPFDGVIPGIMPRDTIKEVASSDNGQFVLSTPDRSRLVAVQTPQVFRCQAIKAAYELASKEGFYSTDDSALIEAAGGKVRVVPGEPGNIKLTTPEDIVTAKEFFRSAWAGPLGTGTLG